MAWSVSQQLRELQSLVKVTELVLRTESGPKPSQPGPKADALSWSPCLVLRLPQVMTRFCRVPWWRVSIRFQ